jgi:hypothetical protein
MELDRSKDKEENLLAKITNNNAICSRILLVFLVIDHFTRALRKCVQVPCFSSTFLSWQSWITAKIMKYKYILVL